MGFHEVQFPTDISYGSRGGPGFNTAIIENDAGVEQRVSRWSDPRRVYDVSYGIKNYAQLATMLSFYMAREGGAHGFRYKDFTDFTTAADHRSATTNVDCVLGTYSSSLSFQLQKKYVSGPTTKYRAITKPVAGTVKVAIDGVNTTAFTVDTTTGIVTLNSAPALGAQISAGCEFDVPVAFTEELDRLLSISIDSFNSASLPACNLVEIKNPTAQVDPFGGNWGGACEVVISSDYAPTLASGRLQVVQATTFGLKVRLPNPASMPTGGPLFFITVVGSNSVDVTNHDGTTTFISGLSPGQGVEACLTVDGGGNNIWMLF